MKYITKPTLYIPICCFFCMTMNLSCQKSATKSTNSAPTLKACYKTDIKVDGRLEEWKEVNFIYIDHKNGIYDTESRTTPPDSAKDLSYRFAACYDDDALYIAVEVTDDVTIADDTKPGAINEECYKDDAVEIFIDGNFNRATNARDKAGLEYKYGGEFAISVNGAATSICTGWPETFGKPGFWHGATNWDDIKAGRTKLCRYEFRIPWKMMGQNSKPKKIGFTIGVQDDDDGQKRDQALYWSGKVPHCYLDESGWGIIILQK